VRKCTGARASLRNRGERWRTPVRARPRRNPCAAGPEPNPSAAMGWHRFSDSRARRRSDRWWCEALVPPALGTTGREVVSQVIRAPRAEAAAGTPHAPGGRQRPTDRTKGEYPERAVGERVDDEAGPDEDCRYSQQQSRSTKKHTSKHDPPMRFLKAISGLAGSQQNDIHAGDQVVAIPSICDSAWPTGRGVTKFEAIIVTRQPLR